MNFNIETVATDMLSVMKGTLPDSWTKVEGVARRFMHDRENRLKHLAESYLKNEITQQKLESRLEDEKIILEAEIEALKVISKALAQKAVNAAFEVLNKAIITAL